MGVEDGGVEKWGVLKRPAHLPLNGQCFTPSTAGLALDSGSGMVGIFVVLFFVVLFFVFSFWFWFCFLRKRLGSWTLTLDKGSFWEKV